LKFGGVGFRGPFFWTGYCVVERYDDVNGQTIISAITSSAALHV